MAFTPLVSTTHTRGKLFVIAGQSLCVLPGASRHELPQGLARPGALVLGELDGTPCFTWELEPGEAPPQGSQPLPLRQLFASLSEDDFGVSGRALGLTAWDRDHRFCGRCGTATVRDAVERQKRCPNCGFHSYPRLSPAIIALVERDGRALLARNARVQMPFHSTLAGFVEVGETLEEAVAREIKEEAGIAISDIRYFGSQPWPFSGSLMIGFTARWKSGEIHQEPTEIADANWFAPDQMPRVAPKLSIARRLIDDFISRQGFPPIP